MGAEHSFQSCAVYLRMSLGGTCGYYQIIVIDPRSVVLGIVLTIVLTIALTLLIFVITDAYFLCRCINFFHRGVGEYRYTKVSVVLFCPHYHALVRRDVAF